MSTREALIRDIEQQPDHVVEELHHFVNFLQNSQSARQAYKDKKAAGEVGERGWPIGYFEKYYGILADVPFERPPQPPMEKREDW